MKNLTQKAVISIILPLFIIIFSVIDYSNIKIKNIELKQEIKTKEKLLKKLNFQENELKRAMNELKIKIPE